MKKGEMHELGHAPPLLGMFWKACRHQRPALGRLLPSMQLFLERMIYRSVRNTVSADSLVS